jgi:hypothetical protein
MSLTIRKRHRNRHASTGVTALVALTVAVMASFLGQTGTAFAVAAKPVATKSAAASVRTTAPKPNAKPDAKAQHAAAVREISAGDVPAACSGAIDPDTMYSCSTPPAGGASFSLTLAQSTDLVLVQVVSTDDQPVYPVLTAPDGSAVTCDRPDGAYGALRCKTGQTGTYTLQVPNSGFSVAYTALLSDTSCTAVTEADSALGAPADLSGTLAAGSAGNCYSLPMAAGDVLRSHLSAWQVTETVYDATGTQVCSTRANNATDLDCTLTGTAPFRVLTNQSYATSMDHTISLARLSSPAGCPTVGPQAYGTVPATTSTARCRIVHVSAAGSYLFGPVGDSVSGSLYGADGTPACTPVLLKPCTLATGDYTWARDGRDTTAAAFGIWSYATNLTQGCTAARDDDFASGPATGSFGGPGEQLCLALPSATGQGLYLIDRTPAGGAHPGVSVYDAAGVPQCVNGNAPMVCKLTGTAPFHAVLAGSGTGTYQLAVQRTDNTSGCTAWPQSAFGGSWGAQVSLTTDQQIACLGIGAGQHSTAEIVDYTNTLNQINAAVRVYDGAGNQVCTTLGSSTTTCKFASGASYTALLTGTGHADTYKLVRRDISPTATCAAPESVTVGAPSTPYTFKSALDSACLRVTAAATDKLWFSVRTPTAARNTGALLGVVDASGTIVCWQRGVLPCRATGSTSYVVIVLASGYAGTSITAHVDAWRIGTAAGWASQCTSHVVSPDGFSLRSGTLTESSTAYCAVIQMKPSQRFEVYGTDSSTTSGVPWVDLIGNFGSSGGGIASGYQCFGDNVGDFSFSCLTDSSAVAGQYVLVVSPADAETPVEYSMQGVCRQGCSTQPKAADVASVSPASGPAGTSNQVVLHGTGLTLGTKVGLYSNAGPASSYRMSEPVSVSPDGTSLTVRLSTYDVAPGTYDLVVEGVGYTVGTRSPGYLPGAYTVTAAPTGTQSRLVPVTATRFLDTRNGTGAPKARVGAGGVVKLRVAGVHGVPASGVTAVVMNVTAVGPTAAGHVTVYPDGQALPSVSNVNFKAKQTISNLVTVPVHNGMVDLRNSAGSVDLVADVAGYYSGGGSGSALTPVTATRFLDTRNAIGAPKARVGAGGVVKLKVAGVHGVPASGVTAVVMNVTAVKPTAAGHVTVYPDGQALPAVSNLNFTAGETIPNLVIVPVVNGTVDLRNSAGSVDLVADVTGYFSTAGSTFVSSDPVRLLDTRSGLGARAGVVGPGGVVSLQVDGVAGVPSSGVTAVVLNVTVTAPTAGSFLTVHPHGQPLPGVSNLNFAAGETIANLVVVPVIDGRVTFTNHSGDVQVIADLNGYYRS